MHGLRLINNNYVASGDGRDAIVYHDGGFRGGNAGRDNISQHLHKPMAGSPKLRRQSTLGYNARVEASTQHLNLSKSSASFLQEVKEKIKKEEDTRTSLHNRGDLPELLRSKSDPGLTGSTPFARSVGLGATSRMHPLASTSPKSLTQKLVTTSSFRGTQTAEPAWTKNLTLPVRSGYSRMPFGGVWPN